MANKKFSDFSTKTDPANVEFVVGYDGSDNVKISIANMNSAYLPLAGGTITGDVKFNDNVDLKLGSSNDCTLMHDGTDTWIDNGTGELYIRNQSDDKDIFFQSDDGSGGTATYFYLDGSIVENRFSKATRHNDNIIAKFGDGNDLNIYHNATNSYISNITGDLYIEQLNDNGDIIFKSDDGSGGTTTYFYLDGSLADGTYTYTRFNDGGVVTFGGDQDLRIWHDPSNSSSYIRNYTNDLFIENTADNSDIIFKSDDGSGGIAEYFRLDGGATKVVASKNFAFTDDVKAEFGDSGDFQIYHDGSNSYINDTGTGNLFLAGQQVYITNAAASEYKARFITDGAVELYYDNSKKFETTSTGIDVTGTTDTDNLTIAGAQGSDGQVLTSTGSGVAWEDAGGGGASSLNDLSDVLIDGTSDYFVNIPAGLSGNPADNLIIGSNAGTDLTTGTENVLIGKDAGENVIGATENTFVGVDSGTLITAGSRNTFLGNSAGFNTGNSITDMVAVGFKAATYAAAGSAVAIGRESGRSNSGNGRIDIGVKTGYSNTSGSWNTNVGYFAAYTNTTGSENTVIGTEAGYNNTGTGNTFLGYQAGYNQTTGSNNTVIGHDAEPSAVDATDEITLGDSNIATLRCQVTTITSLSDKRDKTNIQDSNYGLNIIDSLNPVTFEWNQRDGNRKGLKDLGFIAQDLQELDDDYLRLVYASNPDKLEASYGRLIPVLVKAIQELREEVRNCKNCNN